MTGSLPALLRPVLPVPMLLALVLSCGAPAGAEPIPPRPLDGLARQILERLARERAAAGIDPLASPESMLAAARDWALDIAARPPDERMQVSSPPGRWLERAGLPAAGHDLEEVILLRHAERPADEALRLLRTLEDGWSLALSPATRAAAVGVARASDGWIVVVVALATGPDGDAAGRTAQFSPAGLDRLREAIAEGGARVRRERGLPRLTRDPRLDAACTQHARELARRGLLDHRSEDGSTVGDRLAAVGFRYRLVAENLALIEGAIDPVEEAVQGWMDSPGHRENMLDATARLTGVGVAQDERGRLFVVQVFVAPPDRPDARQE